MEPAAAAEAEGRAGRGVGGAEGLAAAAADWRLVLFRPMLYRLLLQLSLVQRERPEREGHRAVLGQSEVKADKVLLVLSSPYLEEGAGPTNATA